ncbi:MAG: DUF5671 domain-containing protein [Patescibacteria group bacterium]|nr:DUF5671 domain-containing protein [Patescibacteria group bacterium]
MDKPRATPKDFFLWAGAMLSLYTGVFAFIALIFNYIDYAFPNELYYVSPYQSGISYQMASLIVLTPVLLILMRLIRSDIAADTTRLEIWVRRWALYLTVFAAGAGVVVDFIVLLTTFLRGEELTTGFLLKTLVVFLVAGAVFLHFLADLRGYWQENRARAKMINLGVGVLVLASIIAGFFIVGTPWQARQYLQDERRVQDLQSIQSQIVMYWQQKEKLPSDLEELRDPLSGFAVPTDPQTGETYIYEATGSLSFNLCATFNRAGREGLGAPEARIPGYYVDENWQHEAGEYCFERTIDPERYPPYEKAIPAMIR